MAEASRRPNHFVAYVLWDIILDWKKSEVLKGRLKKEEHNKPYAYGTKTKWIKNKIKKNDILWIFTIPRFGKFSSVPSLIARMEVLKVIDRNYPKKKELSEIPTYIKKYRDPKTNEKWRYVIIGKKKNGSTYFPINNAYDLVKKNMVKSIKKEIYDKIKKGEYGYLGRNLQTFRKVCQKVGNKLNEFADKIEKSKSIFVSYRRKEGAKTVGKVVESLLKEDVNCWLDINRLPQGLTGKIRSKASRYFIHEIDNAIRESSCFLAIQGENYFDSNWTILEYISAKTKDLTQKYGVFEKKLTELHTKRAIKDLTIEIDEFLGPRK